MRHDRPRPFGGRSPGPYGPGSALPRREAFVLCAVAIRPCYALIIHAARVSRVIAP